MNESNDEILDSPLDASRNNRPIRILFTLAILLLAYWFVADEMDWPFKSWGLLSGLILLAVITVIQFITKSKPALFEISYFVGKLVLIAGIFVSFMGLPHPYYYIIAAAIFFFIGIVIPVAYRIKP